MEKLCERLQVQLDEALNKRKQLDQEVEDFKNGKILPEDMAKGLTVAKLVDAWGQRYRALDIDINVLSDLLKGCR